jgi:hypothetical protein
MACDVKADGEGVWSWHPGLVLSAQGDDLRATVTNKVMDTGESAQKALNHRAGKAGSLRLKL